LYNKSNAHHYPTNLELSNVGDIKAAYYEEKQDSVEYDQPLVRKEETVNKYSRISF